MPYLAQLTGRLVREGTGASGTHGLGDPARRQDLRMAADTPSSIAELPDVGEEHSRCLLK